MSTLIYAHVCDTRNSTRCSPFQVSPVTLLIIPTVDSPVEEVLEPLPPCPHIPWERARRKEMLYFPVHVSINHSFDYGMVGTVKEDALHVSQGGPSALASECRFTLGLQAKELKNPLPFVNRLEPVHSLFTWSPCQSLELVFRCATCDFLVH
jgi:hypothetical protein